MLAFLAIFSFASIASNEAGASNSRVVTVFADDSERTISTHVGTVAEALEKADIKVGEHDLVEPDLDTPIIDAVFRINVYRARPVTVVDGENVRQVVSPYRSERLIAADAGIIVYDEDKFELERIEDFLNGSIGQRLTIIRATPATIELYGTDIDYRTHQSTVGEVLAEAGVIPTETDKVEPSLDTSINEGMKIRVVHVGTDVEVSQEPIPFEIESIYDSNTLQGINEVKTPGEDGVQLVTYEVQKENNQEISRSQLQNVVSKQPVTQVVVVGTKVPDPASNQAIGQRLAAERGWAGGEWTCLYNLWVKESQWSHAAENPYSGAYGIPQALPGSKMASVADDWRTNPETQITWGLDYIAQRYSTPCGAWNFFLNVAPTYNGSNWY